VSNAPTGQYYGLVTDGTNLYAATRPGGAGGSGTILAVSSAGAIVWSKAAPPSGASAEPAFEISGKLLVSDYSSGVDEFDPATGNFTALTTLSTGTYGRIPLQGSDGHFYLPRTTGYMLAYEGANISWTFDPPGNIFRGGAMDCAGRLFVSSGNIVYAFVTDDHGLADTPWPSMRRDARNTGNASAPKYGIRTASGCTQ
jgi:hypothetical protein